MVSAIWIGLTILGIWVALLLLRDYLRHKHNLEPNSWWKTGVIGFIGNFFDTLGIGSFAIETALFKFTKQTEDRLIPGTLNVANSIPTMAQGIIFIQIVTVEPITLVTMLLASGLGAVLGAGVVAKLSERKIRLTMGIALLITSGFMLASKLNWIQGGGEAIGLEGYKLAIGIGVNFILGALMTAGIGLYAPCMALVFALGMSPAVAFPIMMGSCAVLMPLASIRFIKEGAYNRRASFIISITGLIAVLIAAFVVKSLPLDTLRWLVIVVIVYTATVMLRAGLSSPKIEPQNVK
ncbi:MAG: sulfite exporter TauE/SafE family protein [Cyclobacteriaceae bacterium]|nr:sulfite exporter TauE/SafE family protein [Cyclobacteriaceae bacterium]